MLPEPDESWSHERGLQPRPDSRAEEVVTGGSKHSDLTLLKPSNHLLVLALSDTIKSEIAPRSASQMQTSLENGMGKENGEKQHKATLDVQLDSSGEPITLLSA